MSAKRSKLPCSDNHRKAQRKPTAGRVTPDDRDRVMRIIRARCGVGVKGSDDDDDANQRSYERRRAP